MGSGASKTGSSVQGHDATGRDPLPELNLRIVRHLVCYLSEHHSTREIQSIATDSGVPDANFISSSGWVTLEQFESLLAGARALMRDDATFLEACAYKADVVSGPLRLVMSAASPLAAYVLGVKIMRNVTRISHFKAEVLSRARVRLRYYTTKQESYLMCLSRQAQIRSVPRLWGLPHAQVDHTSCVVGGDAFCTYEVRLDEARRWLPVVVAAAGAVVLGLGWEAAADAPIGWYAFAFAGAALGYLYEIRRAITAKRTTRAAMSDTYEEMANAESSAQRDLFALTRLRTSSSELPEQPAKVVAPKLRLVPKPKVEPAAAHGPEEARFKRTLVGTFSNEDTVADRYVIKRRVATGGMGEVYEAHDRWIDDVVALKTIIPTIADNDQALARLKAEVKLARQVTHDNVCRVFDLGFHRRGGEQIAFLTMELVRGTTLRRRVQQAGPFGVEEARIVVRQMVAALSHAHAAGVIHRDFKSDNVMLVEADGSSPMRVVVTDFGLARSLLVADSQPLTSSSHNVLGTLDYMSPEQVQGQPATEASDIFSVGVVLFELLTGRLPFEGDSPLARALKRVTHAAPEVRKFAPELPPEWGGCVARCLELAPGNRFASLEELLGALEGQGSSSERAPAPADPDATASPI